MGKLFEIGPVVMEIRALKVEKKHEFRGFLLCWGARNTMDFIPILSKPNHIKNQQFLLTPPVFGVVGPSAA